MKDINKIRVGTPTEQLEDEKIGMKNCGKVNIYQMSRDERVVSSTLFIKNMI